MMQVQPIFLKTLLAYIKSTYLPAKRHNPKYPDSFTSGDLHFFAPAVAELSAAFTSERNSRHANYFNTKEARSSYLLYFLVPNMLKVQWIFEQQHFADLFSEETEVRIADIGCGPCTGILAAAQYWQSHAPQQKLSCVAVDQNTAMLKDGRNLLNKLTEHNSKDGTTLTTHAATLAQLRKALGNNRFHILIVANVLNELRSTEERFDFVSRLMSQHLTPNGRLVIIDPALQRSTRDLMLLRDQLVTEQKVARVLAPCLHQQLCPMRIANPRDWCHSYLEWERPQVIADLDMLVGNRKEYLKMSYMVMSAVQNVPKQKIGDTWRVVSAPMKSKGKVEILFCGENGKMLRVTRLDKDRSKENSGLDQLQRGDVVRYGGDERCLPNTVVAIQIP